MRLGILGGTFNPIHLGHLILAEAAREQARLDQVWFVPTAIPPHKRPRELASAAARWDMVRLAIREQPALRADAVELRRGGVSYTVETIRAIRRRVPRARLFLIVGSEMLQVRWVGLTEIAESCTFLVASRTTARPRRPRGLRIQWVRMPRIEISSSMIRARRHHRRSIRFLVPDAVARCIARRHLYRNQATLRLAPPHVWLRQTKPRGASLRIPPHGQSPWGSTHR